LALYRQFAAPAPTAALAFEPQGKALAKRLP
jgi:hypothetical protein